MLALEGVRIRGRDAVLIDGFCLSLSAGEFVALMGPSGCGKSLLLRVAAGLDRPDAGDRVCLPAATMVATGATSATSTAGASRAGASRIAFVFQEGGLLRNVTVAENLRLPLYYRGLGHAAARDAAEAALEEFGVAAFADERPSELLNETRILVQLARAAALDASLLFLDDPFPLLALPAETRVARWISDRLQAGSLAVMMSAVEPQSVPQIPGIRVRVVDIGGPLVREGEDA